MELINKIKNILSPYNFNFIHEESVESTMISIKNFIGSQNVCMIADEQTSGIGRRGNEWVSPKGNIYICLLYTSPSPRDGLLYRMPSSA